MHSFPFSFFSLRFFHHFIHHLKGAQPQLDVQSGCDTGVLRQEGKHRVVHPEQRDQKKSWFRQPPVEKARKARLQIWTSEEKLKRRNNLIGTPSSARVSAVDVTKLSSKEDPCETSKKKKERKQRGTSGLRTLFRLFPFQRFSPSCLATSLKALLHCLSGFRTSVYLNKPLNTGPLMLALAC